MSSKAARRRRAELYKFGVILDTMRKDHLDLARSPDPEAVKAHERHQDARKGLIRSHGIVTRRTQAPRA